MTPEVLFAIDDGVLSIYDEGQRPVWEGRPDELPVLDVKMANGEPSAYVLLDPPPGGQRVQNLIKMSRMGRVLWRGELPGREPSDAFVSLQLDVDGSVIAGTWSGHLARLDPGTGRIINEAFTK